MPWVLIFKKYTRDQRLIHWLWKRDYGQSFDKRNHYKCYLFVLNSKNLIYNGNTTDQMWDRKAQPILTDEL